MKIRYVSADGLSLETDSHMEVISLSVVRRACCWPLSYKEIESDVSSSYIPDDLIREYEFKEKITKGLEEIYIFTEKRRGQ